QTAREAASSATMLMTTCTIAAASRGESATVAPSTARASDLARLRLYTTTGNFSESRRFAMPEPISPNPRIATRVLDIVWFILWEQRSLALLLLASRARDCAARVRTLRIALA